MENTPFFLVDVKINPENEIFIEFDSEADNITIDECVDLSKFVESRLDREKEDFSLEVGSAGLGQPFKVLKQYEKNIGNEVETLTKEGLKFTGLLLEVHPTEFVIEIEKSVKPEGAKRKIIVSEKLTFSYEDIKTTKYIIRFK